jgi:hypothetical protein
MDGSQKTGNIETWQMATVAKCWLRTNLCCSTFQVIGPFIIRALRFAPRSARLALDWESISDQKRKLQCRHRYTQNAFRQRKKCQ